MSNSKTKYSDEYSKMEMIPGTDITGKMIAETTNKCYQQALENLNISNKADVWQAQINPDIRKIVGKEYIRLIKQLPTETLDHILQAHEYEIVIREESTVQEILQELFDRTFLRQ